VNASVSRMNPLLKSLGLPELAPPPKKTTAM